MTYLVDANVISEPTKPLPSGTVVEWLRTNERNLVVDSIILGELCIGILALPLGRKRTELEQWFGEVVQTIDCLSWEAPISRRWAKLVVDLKQNGDQLPLPDSMIAATALQHDFTVATRNIRDFKKAGVKVLNPFA